MEDKSIFIAAMQQINRPIIDEISRFRDLEAGAAQPCTAQQPALPTLCGWRSSVGSWQEICTIV